MTDLVNHPPHYQTAAGIEAIDVIEQYGLGLHLGNAMKYLLRAGRKGDTATDLGKARWYLARWLDGIYMWHGVEYPTASDDIEGGLCWQTPDDIAAAFGLTGARRIAVLNILDAAAFEPEPDGIVDLIKAALDAIASEVGAAA